MEIFTNGSKSIRRNTVVYIKRDGEQNCFHCCWAFLYDYNDDDKGNLLVAPFPNSVSLADGPLLHDYTEYTRQ